KSRRGAGGGPEDKDMRPDQNRGASRVMTGEPPDQPPPMQSMVHLYVPNADSVYERAVAAGGTSAMAPTDMFYGDRAGSVKDPSGNHWYIATHKEDVDIPELKKRAEAMFKQKGQAA